MTSKKRFDHIEDKIKQAAENNLPAFDERAWEAMEKKLDKEDKRRRPIFWWILLPLLLTGSVGAYIIFKPSSAGNSNEAVIAAAEKNKQADIQKEQSNPSATGKENLPVSNPEEKNNTVKIERAEVKPPASITREDKDIANYGEPIIRKRRSANPSTASLYTRKKIGGTKKGKMTVNTFGNIAADVVTGADETIASNNAVATIADAENKKPTLDKTLAGNDKQQPPVVDYNKPVNKKEIPKPKDSTAAQKKESPVKQKEKEKNKTSKGFYILAAIGTDAGSTKLFSYSNSSITPKYGLGLGYRFGNKLSVQTGFYASNKKYLAFAGDYKIKPGSYWENVHMQKVKAACLVYEIPLTLRYDFIQRSSLTFYGTAGASSYIMQKEDYDYFYTAYNMPYESEWEYTGNRHLFSTLSFSIGIEKKLSEKFALLAEPSFSIPLSGVGDGKVKLYSSSLMVGLKYYLQQKKK